MSRQSLTSSSSSSAGARHHVLLSLFLSFIFLSSAAAAQRVSGSSEYASSTAIYSPQGRVLQVEGAKTVARKGRLCTALRASNGLVIVTESDATSLAGTEMEKKESKMELLDDHICLATAGLMSDAKIISKIGKQICRDHKRLFSDNGGVPVENLSDELATLMHKQTRRAGSRPFGLEVLVAGVDALLGPQLYSISTDGRCEGWKAVAIGSARQGMASSLLGKIWQERRTVEETVALLERDGSKLLTDLFSADPGEREDESKDVVDPGVTIEICTCTLETTASAASTYSWARRKVTLPRPPS